MSHPSVPKMSYNAFSQQLEKKVKGKRFPLAVELEITQRCNLKCVHCYCNLKANDKKAKKEELTFKKISQLLDTMAVEECLYLLITGGEPLLREDFSDIYLYALKKGFILTLFTNGTLITPKIADYFSQYPPARIEVTLYGITEQTYQRITRVPGSFKKCLRGIRLLKERGVPFGLKSMALSLNKEELGKMEDFAQDLGVKFRYDYGVHPRLDGSRRPCQFRLSPQEVIALDLSDKKRLQSLKEFSQKFKYYMDDRLYTCAIGQRSFHIDPYGYLSPCILSRKTQYNLRKGNFQEGSYKFLLQFPEQKINKESKCHSCPLRYLCDVCPGWWQLEGKEDHTPIDYLCQIAQGREKIIKEVR